MEASKIENYQSERGARAYRADYDAKLHRKLSDSAERRIFEGFFAQCPKLETMLDLPCGAGRLQTMFKQHADKVFEADFSQTMIKVNVEEHGIDSAGYLCCSGLELPFADRSIDAVVSVRLNHHLSEPALREQHVRELMRVGNHAVILTFFSFSSIKNRLRRLRAPFNKKAPKHTMRLAEVERIGRDAGMRLVRTASISRFTSGHVFAMFVRDTQS